MAITDPNIIPTTGTNGTGMQVPPPVGYANNSPSMMQSQPFQPNFGWGPAGVNGGNSLTGVASQLGQGGYAPNTAGGLFGGGTAAPISQAQTQGSFINNPGAGGPVNNGVTGSSTTPLLGGALGGLFGSAGTSIGQGITGAAGSTNAASALNAGYGNMINQQSNLFSGIQNLYNPYTSTGSAATTGLQNLFGGGANGSATPDYSAFQNTPGLGFLQSQGSQAINRNAAATGGLYNPSTMTALSNYNIGTANSYAYQPYVNMLMQAAGLGSNATQGVANAGLTTGQNIGQGYVGQGAANASGILGASGANQSTASGLSNLLGGILGGTGNNGVLGNAIQNMLGINPTNSSALGYLTGDPSGANYLSSLYGNPAASGMTGPSGAALSSGNIASAYGGGPASFAGYGGPSALAPGDLSAPSMGYGDIGLDSTTNAAFADSAGAGAPATGSGAGAANMLMPSTTSPDVLTGMAAAAAPAADLGLSAADSASMYGALDASTNAAMAADAASSGMYGATAAVPLAPGVGAGGLGLLGSAGLVAGAIAPALYGASQPGTSLGSTWYNNLGSTVGAGLGANATVQQKLQAASQLDQLGMMQANGTGGSSGLSTSSNFDFNRLMGVLSQYGVTSISQAHDLANQLFNSIPAGQMPTENSHPMVHQV